MRIHRCQYLPKLGKKTPYSPSKDNYDYENNFQPGHNHHVPTLFLCTFTWMLTVRCTHKRLPYWNSNHGLIFSTDLRRARAWKISTSLSVGRSSNWSRSTPRKVNLRKVRFLGCSSSAYEKYKQHKEITDYTRHFFSVGAIYARRGSSREISRIGLSQKHERSIAETTSSPFKRSVVAIGRGDSLLQTQRLLETSVFVPFGAITGTSHKEAKAKP